MQAFEIIDLIPEQQFKRKRFWSRVIFIGSAVLLLSLILHTVYESYVEQPERKIKWTSYVVYGLLLLVNYRQALFPKQVKKKLLVDATMFEVDEQYAKGFSLSWTEIVKVQLSFSTIRLFTDSNQFQECNVADLSADQKLALRKLVYTLAQEKQIPIEIPSAIKDNLLQ
jgi:hypothetical protein